MTSAIPADVNRAGTAEPRALGFRIPAAVLALVMALTGGKLLVFAWVDPSDHGIHRMQDLHWGVAEGLLLAVPLALSAWRPVQRVAMMRVVFLALAAQVLIGVATLTPDPFAIVLVVLGAALVMAHPARHTLLRPRFHRPGATLRAAAVSTLLLGAAFAAVQVAHHFQAAAGDPLRIKTGWIGAALCSLGISAVAAAGLWLRDHTALAFAAASVLVLGAGSLVHSSAPSSLGLVGGATAVVVASTLLVYLSAGGSRADGSIH